MLRRISHLILAIFVFCGAFAMSACGNGVDPYIPEEKVYYRNPIMAMAPDPHIIRHDGWFYVYATGTRATGGRLLKSRDAVTWENIEGGTGFEPSWGAANAGFWAPDIVKIGNKFLLYYSLSYWGDPNPGIGVASADHPEGPWTDHGKLFDSSEIGVENSIDPCVFIGQDKKVYMIWGSFRGMFGIELTADGLELKNGLSYARENKVLVAGVVGEWDGATFEACYVIYKDGYYYLFLSTGTCCDGLNSTYQVKVGRAASPLGEYTDSTGQSMKGRNVGHHVLASSAVLVGPGHNSVFIDDKGDYFIVYHVYKNESGETTGRGLAMDRLVWENGWCEVKGGMPGNKAEVPYIKTAD